MILPEKIRFESKYVTVILKKSKKKIFFRNFSKNFFFIFFSKKLIFSPKKIFSPQKIFFLSPKKLHLENRMVLVHCSTGDTCLYINTNWTSESDRFYNITLVRPSVSPSRKWSRKPLQGFFRNLAWSWRTIRVKR